MTTVTKLAVIAAALAAIGGMALVATAFVFTVDSGGGQQVVPDGPGVQGRLVYGSVGLLRDGSGVQGICEADAYVRVERDTIVEILEHGDRPEIKVGEKLDHDLYREPSEEVIKERGYPPTGGDVFVYRDGDGIIRTGCPPESTLIIDGVSKTTAEWRAEGKIPQR